MPCTAGSPTTTPSWPALMLLGQLDELTARITQVTALLDAAISALPPWTPTPTTPAPVGPVAPMALPRPAQQRRPSTTRPSRGAMFPQVPGGGPDSVRAVLGEIGLEGIERVRHRRAAVLLGQGRPPHRAVRTQATHRARTGKGNPYLKSALAQIATGAAKTDTFLGARYRRLIKRMPKAKALVALAALHPGHLLPLSPIPPNASTTSAPTTTPSAWTPGAAPPSSPPNYAPSAGQSSLTPLAA